MKREILSQILDDRGAQRPVALLTNLKTGAQGLWHPDQADHPLAEPARLALRSDRPATMDTADGPVFIEPHNPPLRLVLIGAVHIAQPLIAMAGLCGLRVIVVDPRKAFAASTQALLPGLSIIATWPDQALTELNLDGRTAVVTLTHDPKLDDAALSVALRSPAFYIGCLGSGKTHAARLQRLRAAGFTDADLQRIHGPVGLAIGAQSPGEIAVSILAQVIERLRQPR